MSRNRLANTPQLLPATPIRDKSSKAFAGLYDDVDTLRLREVCAMAQILNFIKLEFAERISNYRIRVVTTRAVSGISSRPISSLHSVPRNLAENGLSSLASRK